MPQYEPSIPLRHMLDHAREAFSLAQSRSRVDLETDRLLNLALARLLEIIGEAASRVSIDGRSHYPDIPWPQIIAFRNILIHAYFGIDREVVWLAAVPGPPFGR